MPSSFKIYPNGPDFDLFWAAYPKKLAKGDAKKAWFQTREIRPPLDQILLALRVACASDDWRRDGGQYIPYPATWLRAERWDDNPQIEIAKPPPVADGKVTCRSCGQRVTSHISYWCTECYRKAQPMRAAT